MMTWTPRMEALFQETGDIVQCARAREKAIKAKEAVEFAKIVEEVEKVDALSMGEVGGGGIREHWWGGDRDAPFGAWSRFEWRLVVSRRGVENDLSPTVFFQDGLFCDWENRFCMGICDGCSVRGPVELRARVGWGNFYCFVDFRYLFMFHPDSDICIGRLQ